MRLQRAGRGFAAKRPIAASHASPSASGVDHRIEIVLLRRAWVTRPSASASPAPMRAPVSARYMPDLVRQARQEMAGADIGDKADAGFGHGEAHAGIGQPVAAMHRHARAAAHHDAMQQRDIGFGISADQGVQVIFVAQQCRARIAAVHHRLRTARMSPPAQKARALAPDRHAP